MISTKYQLQMSEVCLQYNIKLKVFFIKKLDMALRISTPLKFCLTIITRRMNCVLCSNTSCLTYADFKSGDAKISSKDIAMNR